MSVPTHLFRYNSPLGPLAVELAGGCVCRIAFEAVDAPLCSPDHPVSLWLRGYFHGRQMPLPEIAPAASEFQERLRQALLGVPFGQTLTYGELAEQLNTSPRALGQALGANPLPILIPCHRIVAADGLGGFSGGLEWKRKLLVWESAGNQAKR